MFTFVFPQKSTETMLSDFFLNRQQSGVAMQLHQSLFEFHRLDGGDFAGNMVESKIKPFIKGNLSGRLGVHLQRKIKLFPKLFLDEDNHK